MTRGRRQTRSLAARPRRRAITLLECMALLIVIGALLWILPGLILDGLRYLELDAAWSQRVAVMNRLTTDLRTAARDGDAVRVDSDRVTFTTTGAPGATTTFVFAEDQVIQRRNGRESASCTATRLSFDFALIPGTRGDALRVTFIEHPPNRASELAPRTYRVLIPLPPVVEDAQ